MVGVGRYSLEPLFVTLVSPNPFASDQSLQHIQLIAGEIFVTTAIAHYVFDVFQGRREVHPGQGHTGSDRKGHPRDWR